MLKKINVQQLRPGMHLQEFCGSWMEHPFFRSSFVLSSAEEIAAILASSITQVWIDCDKGLDVLAGEAVVSEAQSQAKVDDEVKQVAAGKRQIAPVGAAQELERAAKICQRSKQAVLFMFEEARMGNAVDVGGAKLLVEEISDSVARNPGALISLARLKTADDYTYMHSVAVCAMMVALAKQLGLDEAQTRSAGLAGLLHDLGKAVMPVDVLNKPGKLTDAEFTLIKSHPVEGHKMLLCGDNADPIALEVGLHHHEKMDGSGYPDQLAGDQISLWARMGAVCDVYDAITSNRPYKSGWDPAESLRKMAEWTKGHFDPHVFQAFVKSMGIYPVGSLVRLTSGRLGVVMEQTAKSLTTPCVKVFFSTKSNMRIAPQLIDLSRADTREKIAAREDPAQWNFPDINELWSGLPSAPW
ncbi:MAG: HD-GYP domain-containing protein [Gammaproteobacteria bacterium]|uniref:HD-GYP domain-containing protein n=1 Tax=Rhodoferax sp. TaxID=50421 RepID=UPI0017F8A880|nr:HD-GYP domain-containing protein [Rhodoferax sp.]MBU3898045.1 HD-GYP domain-containing protein [Gammaproteobacteria bacterium]MBA3058545.1 HD-GYP domain-containing protein [Rhodoferax sp.]MBU3999198.1 HD-GYP domain-containing protein [Gammaproteobacteria bacterium]MBU4081761.1 HD-GYP domain-containing protein [Gammaproteobacteria bacterium]MBU4112746.1 HD-GYP domain-containing protein [Gammaproteobacteria bacterium]